MKHLLILTALFLSACHREPAKTIIVDGEERKESRCPAKESFTFSGMTTLCDNQGKSEKE